MDQEQTKGLPTSERRQNRCSNAALPVPALLCSNESSAHHIARKYGQHQHIPCRVFQAFGTPPSNHFWQSDGRHQPLQSISDVRKWNVRSGVHKRALWLDGATHSSSTSIWPERIRLKAMPTGGNAHRYCCSAHSAEFFLDPAENHRVRRPHAGSVLHCRMRFLHPVHADQQAQRSCLCVPVAVPLKRRQFRHPIRLHPLSFHQSRYTRIIFPRRQEHAAAKARKQRQNRLAKRDFSANTGHTRCWFIIDEWRVFPRLQC
ncbi:hypothetical protein D3C80_1155230 [compost metagenome]